VSLFVNPTPGLPEPTPDVTGTGNVGTFQRIGLSAGYSTSSPTNTTARGWMDEVRIGTTWESVTLVPEPTAWLLLLSALACGLLVRRRAG